MIKRSQPLRIEDPERILFITSKTINSALWFVNNKKLEEQILTYLAKYQHKYGVILYAMVFQGNHYHLIARFPNCNKSLFMRDLNARISELVREFVPAFKEGPLFKRRYTDQALLVDDDVEDAMFYCALQAVSAGLTSRMSEYPGYNSFSDATSDKVREFKYIQRSKYRAAKRFNKYLSVSKFTEYYKLKYSRLPGKQALSRKEYRQEMYQKLEERRQKIIAARAGAKFLGVEKLKKVAPGALPQSTKSGGRRPFVRTTCAEAKRKFLEWYFSVIELYHKASLEYRRGNVNAVFPPGTYKPSGPLVAV